MAPEPALPSLGESGLAGPTYGERFRDRVHIVGGGVLGFMPWLEGPGDPAVELPMRWVAVPGRYPEKLGRGREVPV